LRLKILKKLRTASLNSEFIGSYKKKSVIVKKAIKLTFKGALNLNFLNLTINREKFWL